MHVFFSLHTLSVMPSLTQCEEFVVKITQNRVFRTAQNTENTPPPSSTKKLEFLMEALETLV